MTSNIYQVAFYGEHQQLLGPRNSRLFRYVLSSNGIILESHSLVC